MRGRSKIVCVVDPEFLVVWSKFRYGSKLAEIIERGYITEDFFDTFSEEKTVSFFRQLLESKVLVVYYDFEEPYDTFLDFLRRTFVEDRRLCQLDKTLVQLLAIAIKEDIPILSDNFCVHKFAVLHWDRSMVLNSYNLLRLMVTRGLFDDFGVLAKDFAEDTGTVFAELRGDRSSPFQLGDIQDLNRGLKT